MRKLSLLLFIYLPLVTYAQIFGNNHHCTEQQIISVEDGVCTDDQYVLIFEDNFDGDHLDRAIWDLPYQGVQRDYNFESTKQWNANTGTTPVLPQDNIVVSNGSLHLIAKRENPPIDGSYQIETGVWGAELFDFSSAEIYSKKYFGHGVYQARCRLAKGKGMYSAFWTYGNSSIWNELDVFEVKNESGCGINFNYDSTKLQKNPRFNSHHDFDQDGNNYDCEGMLYNGCDNWNGPDYSDDFHIFTLIWDEYTMRWYIDGDLKYTVFRYHDDIGQIINCTSLHQWGEYTMAKSFPDNVGMQIHLDLAVQIAQNSPNDYDQFPKDFEIDWVRFYEARSCATNVEKSLNDEDLSGDDYHCISGNNVTLKDYFDVTGGEQLEAVAHTAIILDTGFETFPQGLFEARIDPTIPVCSSQIKNSSDDWKNLDEILGKVQNEQNQSETDSLPTLKSPLEKESDEFSVGPNPTQDKITIRRNSSNTFHLQLVDLYGRTMFETRGREITQVDLSQLQSGTYQLYLIDDVTQQNYYFKVLKN